MRTARLFSLLDHLRTRRQPVSAQVLAVALGVSVRTIYRDMATLQAMGAPIRGEGGVGYQIEKGHFLPPFHFDSDELDAIALGMRMIGARGDEALAEAAARVIAKIEAVVPDADHGKITRSQMIAYSPASRAQRFLGRLRSAIRRRRKLKITYNDSQGADSIRLIRPLGLTAFDAIWLLTAWCEEKNEFRNFRVDRLCDLAQTGAHFSPDTGKEFKDYLKALP
jgi:predicted DNA-binding transcriptional regulator YafY